VVASASEKNSRGLGAQLTIIPRHPKKQFRDFIKCKKLRRRDKNSRYDYRYRSCKGIKVDVLRPLINNT